MNSAEIIEASSKLFVNTYSRYPVAMVEGSGCKLKDAEGREFIDFLAGIAVCNLGHCHPAVTEAICAQAGKLLHVSNLYHTEPQTELAGLLVENSFADRVFMCNSGAEANEAAIKLARKHAPEGKYEIISLEGSFHGRTLAAVTATGQPKFHKGFEPMPEGFIHAPFGDLEALEKLISAKTCAILCEPLQGEGGVRPLAKEYLAGIRALCDQHDLLLIFDEVQVGIGRTGTLFAYEQLGITPDIMTLAKALANGLPIGALLTSETIAETFEPGSHASTFGGNPVVSAAGIAVLKTMLAAGFFDEVKKKGDYLAAMLTEIGERYPTVFSGVRGLGLIQGLILNDPYVDQGAEIINQLFEAGFLANFAGNIALRFLPPLVVSKEEIDLLVAALDKIIAGIS
jgi:acetylornithine aminotransferase/acetylornithine/N-succinyldiaminopimelate aminotransferase